MFTKNTFLIAILVATLISSCSKSENSTDAAPAFAGVYNMTSNCWTGTRAVTIVTNGNNSIILPLVLNEGTSCQKTIAIPASVNGNSILSTTVSVTDACGATYTETVSGTLNGNTLSLTYVTSNSLGSLTCNFLGSK